MVFQYQIVIFFYIISVYTVCHIDHYIKSASSSNKILAHHGKIVLVIIHSGIRRAFWS